MNDELICSLADRGSNPLDSTNIEDSKLIISYLLSFFYEINNFMKILNTDDIFLRNLSISLLELLNSTITIQQSRNNSSESVNVPFQYNYGSDENFLKDFYIGLPDNCNIPTSEGTYDIIPRGVITLDSFQIKSSDITNRFIRAQYTNVEKDEKDENVLNGYSAQLYTLPMSIAFSIKIITASINHAFKISEKILDQVYANRVMYFKYRGLRIPAQFTFPETESIDKKYKFTYSDNNKLYVDLKVDVETYFPSFESSSNRKSSNVMERIQSNTKDDNNILLDRNWIDQNT